MENSLKQEKDETRSRIQELRKKLERERQRKDIKIAGMLIGSASAGIGAGMFTAHNSYMKPINDIQEYIEQLQSYATENKQDVITLIHTAEGMAYRYGRDERIIPQPKQVTIKSLIDEASIEKKYIENMGMTYGDIFWGGVLGIATTIGVWKLGRFLSRPKQK